ncbi:MAG: hypothetical protein SCARUB_05203, partial [Candidatus Scalindua rubra]
MKLYFDNRPRKRPSKGRSLLWRSCGGFKIPTKYFSENIKCFLPSAGTYYLNIGNNLLAYSRILTIFILINCLYSSGNNNSYYFACGQNQEINVFWDYSGQDENFLGCNLIRSEDIQGDYVQVNDDILISSQNQFSYKDTTNIIDTLDYFYKIVYVWQDSSYTDELPIYTFKLIEFQNNDEETINIILENRNDSENELLLYVSSDNIGWDLMFQGILTNPDTVTIDPYYYQDVGYHYLLFEFWSWSEGVQCLGNLKISAEYLIELIEDSAIVNEEITLTYTVILYPNFPNPFNPYTTITYTLTKSGHVRLDVFDLLGNKVKTLTNKRQNPSSYS